MGEEGVGREVGGGGGRGRIGREVGGGGVVYKQILDQLSLGCE